MSLKVLLEDEETENPVVIRLERDGKDINLYAGDILLAWFGDDGSLNIAYQSDDEVGKLEEAGFSIESDGSGDRVAVVL